MNGNESGGGCGCYPETATESPRNWGGLNLSDGELDPDAQHTAFASWDAANMLISNGDSDWLGPSKRDLEEAVTSEEDVHQNPPVGNAKQLPKKSK